MEVTTNKQCTCRVAERSKQIWNTRFTWRKIIFICVILISGIFAQEEEMGMEKAEKVFLQQPTYLQITRKDLVLKIGGALR
jgi:hypothetical protein